MRGSGGAQLSDIRAVLALMSEGKHAARDVVSEIHDPAHAQQAFDRLRDGSDIPGTIAFAWKPE
jgi:threonine dehydrogenase-like Zn-dependent dehydrogenase